MSQSLFPSIYIQRFAEIRSHIFKISPSLSHPTYFSSGFTFFTMYFCWLKEIANFQKSNSEMWNAYSFWSFFIFLANQNQKRFSFLEPTSCIYFLCFIIDSYERMPVSYWLKYLQSLWPNSPINHSHGTQDARSFFFFSTKRRARNVSGLLFLFIFFYPGNNIQIKLGILSLWFLLELQPYVFCSELP